MARICEICGKGPVSGNTVARRGSPKRKGGAGRKITAITKRTFKPNLQRIRAVVKGSPRRIKVCTRCIRSGKVTKAA